MADLLAEIEAELARRESGGGDLLSEIEAELAERDRSGLEKLVDAGADHATQLAAGAAEGTVGTAGLLSDAAEGIAYLLNPGMRRFVERMGPNYEPQAAFGFPTEQYNPLELKNTQTLVEKAREYLPEEKDDLTAYSRTIGEFAAPGGILRGPKYLKEADRALDAVKPLLKETLRREVPAAVAAQAAEDYTGDSTIAPVVGAVLGGSAEDLARSGGKAVRHLFKKPSSKDIRATAAKAFRDLTKNGKALTGEEIDEMIAALPDDELAKLMTTAEVTKNAGAAQLELELAKAGEGANKYAALKATRREARDELLERLARSEAVDEEDLVASLRETAGKTSGKYAALEDELWKEFPKGVPVDVDGAKRRMLREVATKRGYGTTGLHPKVKKLIDQLTSGHDPSLLPPGVDFEDLTKQQQGYLKSLRSSGALQKMRSDALEISRDVNLTSKDKAVADSLARTINDVMEHQLDEADFNVWKAARDTTKEHAERFKGRTSGAKLLDEQISDSNLIDKVVTGDRKSIQQLREAIEDDPKLIDQVKQAVIQRVPRDTQGHLTPHKMRTFLAKKKNGLRELFGDEHFEQLQRVTKDLQSEASVQRLATEASRGQSATSQKLTTAGVVNRAIVGAIDPMVTGPMMDAAEYIRQTAAIKSKEEVTELLLRASLDPQFAADLVRTPERGRIMPLMERLAEMVTNAKRQGGRAGAIALGRSVALDGEGSEGSEGKRSGVQSERNQQHKQRNQKHKARTKIESLQQSAPHSPYNKDPLVPGPLKRAGKAESPELPEGRKIPSYKHDISFPQGKQPDALDLAFNELITDELLDAVRQVESGGGKYLESPAGAKGPYQLMDATGKRLHRMLNLSGDYDPYNEDQARILAAAHLDDGLRRFPGRLDLALADYNAGNSRVKQALALAGDNSEWDALELAFRELDLDETAEYVPKYRELGVI